MLVTRAQFIRKPVDLEELKRLTGEAGDKVDCIVEKTIELEPHEYDNFSKNLLEDHKFIEDSVNLQCVDTKNRWHCILVKAKGAVDGILVQGEGYHYARYAAYLPEVPVDEE